MSAHLRDLRWGQAGIQGSYMSMVSATWIEPPASTIGELWNCSQGLNDRVDVEAGFEVRWTF